jgi:hypothetical protein
MMTASMDTDLENVLEDSLTYSPLKEAANKENTPLSLVNSLDRIRQSPSTARLFSLLGTNQINLPSVESPRGLKPKRLEDLLNTPNDSQGDAAKSGRGKEDLSAELRTLRSSMLVIQRDCDFHRKRALAAQDEVDHLNKYIQTLEEEKKNRQSPDSEAALPSVPPLPLIHLAEIRELKLALTSLETLNKSLSRQNDLLRSRPSLSGNRFARKEAFVQTIFEDHRAPQVDCGTDLDRSPSQASYGSPFKMPLYTPPQIISTGYLPRFTRKEIFTQTETGVWATVEDLLERPTPRRIVSLGSRDADQYIPLPAKKPEPDAKRNRKSLPNDFSPTECLFKGISTVQRSEPQVYVPKISRRERARRPAISQEDSTRPRRGVSTGSISSARHRSDSSKRIWIP